MARRLGFAIGNALQDTGNILLHYGLQQQYRQQQEQNVNLRDLETRVQKGDLEPEAADIEATVKNIKIPRGYFESMRPSPEKMRSGMMSAITKAPTMEQVPSEFELSQSEPVR